MATTAQAVASPDEPSPPKRAVCARCQRPMRACYCAALPSTPLRTRATRVVVLQHAKEQRQRHAISSVPVLANVLDCPQSVTVLSVAIDAGKSERVSEVLCETLHRSLIPLVDNHDVDEDGADAVLVLFPHADAKTLNRELPRQWRRPAATELNAERPSSASVSADMPNDDNKTNRVVLVVVDGTWTEAKKIVHHSQCFWDKLASERRASGKVFEYVCLDPMSLSSAAASATTTAKEQSTGKSIYGDLRKEPMDGCVSTLEAVALALLALEPDQNEAQELHEALCSAFRAMVEIQSQFQQHGRAQQQAKHGGTPKPKHVCTTTSSSSNSTTTTMTSGQGVVKPYVFYTTQTDFRKQQQLVQQGEMQVCTRDAAIALCQEMNRSRKRGERVSALPKEAFERQVQQLSE